MASSSLFTDLAILQDQLRGIWRFKWVALVVAWAVALVAWAIVFLIPNKYQATAKIFVNPGTTLSHATEGISLGDDIDAQIQQVSEMLLGYPQLQKVAGETNLMAGAITAEEQQAVVDHLRANASITADMNNKADPKSQVTVFTLSYEDTDRERAIHVVDRLLNDFVEGSLSGKSQGSQQAEQFLTQQITDYGQRLSATEQQLAEFKKRDIGLVGGAQGTDAFSQVQADSNTLRQLKGSLYVAERRRDELAQEMRTGRQFTTGAAPAIGPEGGAALDTEQQIAVNQQKLDRMLLQYTDRYPDVIALRETIKELKVRQKQQMAAAQKGDVGAATALGLSANPVFQRLEEEYDSERVEVASIQQQISDLEQQITSIKAKIGAAPQVQAEYAQLTRNYDVTKKQYDALLGRLDSTRLGQQAASTGLVDFQVIDPPSAKFTPVSPKRPLLIIGMFFFAIGVGIGIAYLLQRLQPVFVSTRQLGEVTGLPVLGAVSMAWADRHRIETRAGGARYAAWATGLLLVGITLLFLQAHISNVVGELLA